MRYAICNELFEGWELARMLGFVAECGYGGIEIAPFTLGAEAGSVTAGRRREVRREVEKSGLSVVGLHWLLAKTSGFHLTSEEPAVRKRTADYLAALADLCGDLGGAVMVLGSPLQRNLKQGMSKERGEEICAEVIGGCLAALERNGVTLAVEPLGPAEGNFLNTAAEARRLIERVDSPRVRLHLDCKAMCSEAEPIPRIIEANRDLMVHFHANDPNRQGPGFGELKMGPVMAALRGIDYRGWISVEVFDYSPGVERLARESLNHLREAEAG